MPGSTGRSACTPNAWNSAWSASPWAPTAQLAAITAAAAAYNGELSQDLYGDWLAFGDGPPKADIIATFGSWPQAMLAAGLFPKTPATSG